MDEMTSGFIFIEPIPGAPRPKPVFRHEGITFSKSFWKRTTTIIIDYQEIVSHSFLPNVTVTLIKNGEFIPISATEKQTFVMKKNDNWYLDVHSQDANSADGSSSSASMSFSNKTKI